MNTNQKSKWWVDAALFAVFIATFFLNVTGLDLHQWIGVAAGAIASYHLITHWNWVSAVTRRFIGQTSSKSRLYYLLDAAILLGFVAIAGTGLVISTWLNLPLDNYDTWRVVHIAASIGTLIATVVKMGLHWRWIVTVAKSLFTRPSIPQRRLAPVPSSNRARRLRRREFLGVMGGVGLASVFALNNAAQALQLSPAQENSFDSTTDSSLPTASGGANPVQPVAAGQPVQPSATAAVRSTITPTLVAKSATTAAITVVPAIATATATAIPTQNPVASSCVVRCRNGCSYPGRCRRYVDANDNGRCDLGECL